MLSNLDDSEQEESEDDQNNRVEADVEKNKTTENLVEITDNIVEIEAAKSNPSENTDEINVEQINDEIAIPVLKSEMQQPKPNHVPQEGIIKLHRQKWPTKIQTLKNRKHPDPITQLYH